MLELKLFTGQGRRRKGERREKAFTETKYQQCDRLAEPAVCVCGVCVCV